jgi:hypothetical protein
VNVVGAQSIDGNEKNAGTGCLVRCGLAGHAGTNSYVAAEHDKKDPHGIERITAQVFDGWPRRLLRLFRMMVTLTAFPVDRGTRGRLIYKQLSSFMPF